MVAASASELLDPGAAAQPAAPRRRLRRQRPGPGDRRRPPRPPARRLGRRPAGRSYADRPEVAAALHGHGEQITRDSKTLGAEILATSAPVLEPRPPRRRGPDHPERRRRQHGGADLDPRPRGSGRRRPAARASAPGRSSPSRIARPIRRLDRAARRVADRRPRPGGRGRGQHRAALARARLQRDDRADQAPAAGPAGLRRRRLPSAAHAAHGAAAAPRGARRTLSAASDPPRPSSRRRWRRSTGSR